jgi:hypothetical protein
MQRCNTRSKIKNGYTLYVISGLSKTVTKKFKKYKLLPLLCYILCEKIIKIRHLDPKL